MGQSGRYNHLSREQLIELLERRDVRRNFGLVWEREGIEPDRAMNTDFVALQLDTGLSTAPMDERGWRNLVIEGDNWDALRALRLAFAGRIKCILIDPPYNTGSKDFTYNDRFVGPQDRYRQSLWLEFLYRRLLIARDLLADDGAILVCINDENRARLDLLMEQVFPGMRVGSFVWRTRTTTNDIGGRRLSVDHEHVLVFGNSEFAFGGVNKDFSYYSNPDNDERGDWYPGDLTVAVKYDDRRAGNCFYPIYDPDAGVWYPCNPERVWAYGSEKKSKAGQKLRAKSMERLVAEKRIVFPKNNRVEIWPTKEALLEAIRRRDVPQGNNGNLWLREGLPDLDFFVGKPVGWGKPAMKRFAKEVRRRTAPASSWVAPKTELAAAPSDDNGDNGGGYSIREGTKTVQRLLGERAFSFPKPETLIRHLLTQTVGDDDLVLDFFAGSGTTAHALLKLNAEDDGSRRFIMVSNTEATAEEPEKNLCRDVCARRIRNAIAGDDKDGGLPGDFAYLRTRRIAWDDVLYELDDGALWTLLQLRHDRPVRPFDPAAPVQIAHPDPRRPADPIIAFLPRVTEEAVAQLRQLAVLGSLVAFSPAPALLRDALAMPTVPVEQVPDRLLAEFPQLIAGL